MIDRRPVISYLSEKAESSRHESATRSVARPWVPTAVCHALLPTTRNELSVCEHTEPGHLRQEQGRFGRRQEEGLLSDVATAKDESPAETKECAKSRATVSGSNYSRAVS